MWKTIIPGQWLRRLAAICSIVLASALFLLSLRRQSEHQRVFKPAKV